MLGRDQMMISQDHYGYKDGGHLTIYVNGSGTLKARFQSEEETRYLHFSDEKVQAGETYHVAFTFDADEIQLFVNGDLADTDIGFPEGMSGNAEDMMLAASTTTRKEEDDNVNSFFKGTIESAPDVGRSSPHSIRIVVVLPAPLGPMNPMM